MAKTQQVHFWTIIPAAGKGTRFHATCPENYSDAVFSSESGLPFSSAAQSAAKQTKTKPYYLLTKQHNKPALAVRFFVQFLNDPVVARRGLTCHE
mgnify:CR=1 FL=1